MCKGRWNGRYYDALAGLLKEYIRVASLLSSEFAVHSVYPELLFQVSLASEGSARLPLKLLEGFCELFSDTGDSEAQTNRMQVLIHRLFFDFFVSEERILRSGTEKKVNVLQELLSKEQGKGAVHYLYFALEAKRSTEFWTKRKEKRINEARVQQIRLRKRKEALTATSTGEVGDDSQGCYAPACQGVCRAS